MDYGPLVVDTSQDVGVLGSALRHDYKVDSIMNATPARPDASIKAPQGKHLLKLVGIVSEVHSTRSFIANFTLPSTQSPADTYPVALVRSWIFMLTLL